jgi:hypothetical protein
VGKAPALISIAVAAIRAVFRKGPPMFISSSSGFVDLTEAEPGPGRLMCPDNGAGLRKMLVMGR